ncbi:MAG: hypothetical protein JNM07_10210 [Phycisphaerae bacterium]|nr:hypothetical protein [Phycisphaerae bacterium]
MNARACPIDAVSPDEPGAHFFFGYYDKCPWGPGDAARAPLLAHRTQFIDRFPDPGDPAAVGLIDPATRVFTPLAETRAWNWQQGAQLQWVKRPDRGDDAEVILYNDRRPSARDPHRLLSVMIDTCGRELARWDSPVYAVSPDGAAALTLSYPRLARLRPEYGYPGLKDPNSDADAPDDDGVWRLDLRSGRRELIASIAQVAAFRPAPLGAGRTHYVNHLMFNRSGTRLCFLHRFERADGITHSRLFTLGLDGADLRLLFEGMISHYHWRDDRTILAWAGRRKLLTLGGEGGGDRDTGARNPVAAAKGVALNAARRTLKPIYYALGKPRWMMNRFLRDAYILITDSPDAPTADFAPGELTCDGHCTFSPDGRWVLTDGYPDRRTRQPLWLWDTTRNEGWEIGRYPTPRELDGPVRVDLHPRFSRDGTRVCIDSAMPRSGDTAPRRRMFVCDVSLVTGTGAGGGGGARGAAGNR